MAKNGPPPQIPVYPYYIPSVPTVVSVAPSSNMEPKIISIPSVENNLAGGECAEIVESSNSLSDRTNPHFIHHPSSSSESVSNLQWRNDRCMFKCNLNILKSGCFCFVRRALCLYVCVLAWLMSPCVHTVRLCVCVSTSTVRSGYRVKASPDQDSMKVLYYIEKELAQFPSAKMAALKRKPAQTGPVSVICVAVWPSVCLFNVHGLCKLTSASVRLTLTFMS